MASKHYGLDLTLERIINTNWEYPLHVDSLFKLGLHCDDKALVLRRLNSLAKHGRIRKSGWRGLVTWDTVCPANLAKRAEKERKEAADQIAARKAYIALGFATDPETVVLPSCDRDHNCSERCHEAYNDAYEKREALEDNLSRLCNHTIKLTPKQFLMLASEFQANVGTISISDMRKS